MSARPVSALDQIPIETTADYARIASAIDFLRDRRGAQPDLRALSTHLGLSESRTQRLFSRWAGISPKRFVQFLTVEYAKACMNDTADLLDVALESGLSGPGRLHDLFVGLEAMSPGEYRAAASGLTVRYGFGTTAFGDALIAWTMRGICHLAFVDTTVGDGLIPALRQQWPGAEFQRDNEGAQSLLRQVFERSPGADAGLSVWVSGTNFQIQVWRALLRVPFAGLLSYGQFATLLGKPKAARAVGSAIAANRIAYLIPCHRVLRESGEFGAYRWGGERKMALCAWEAAQQRPIASSNDLVVSGEPL